MFRGLECRVQESGGPKVIHALYLFFFACALSDFVELRKFLGPFGSVPGLLVEMGSGLLFFALVLQFARQRKAYVSPKYLICGALIFIHILLGMFINGSNAGTMFSGLRLYIALVPLFFLPAVFVISEKDMTKILKMFWLLMFIQVPVAIYQRIFLFGLYGADSGDPVRGTFSAGSLHTTMIIVTALILGAFWIRGQLRLRTLIAGCSLIMLPMFLNETKAAIVLMTAGIISLVYLGSKGRQKVLKVIGATAASAVFVLIFAAGYDFFFPNARQGVGLLTFYQEKAIANEYDGIDDPREVVQVKRIDSVVLAYRELSKDPIQLLFGLGAGSISHPAKSGVLAGDYADYFDLYNVSRTTYTITLWELGLIGIVLIGVFFVLLFFDARKLLSSQGFLGSFALGWAAVLAILPLTLAYKNIITSALVMAPILLLSGYIAAQRVRGLAGADTSYSGTVQEAPRIKWATMPPTLAEASKVD